MTTSDMAGEIFRFVVLLPHRDAALNVKKEADFLGACFLRAGIKAYAFPPAVFLARVRSPQKFNVLKKSALSLRRGLCVNEEGGAARRGFIAPSDFMVLPFFEDKNLALFGRRVALPRLQFEGAEFYYNETPLVYFLLGGARPVLPPLVPFSDFAPPPFRAASLANMALRFRADPPSIEWKTGRLAWLPKAGINFER